MVSQCAGSRRAVSLTQAAAQVTEERVTGNRGRGQENQNIKLSDLDHGEKLDGLGRFRAR